MKRSTQHRTDQLDALPATDPPAGATTVETQPVAALRDQLAGGRRQSLAAAVEPLLIDRRRFAELLSVGVATLDRMRAAGRIPQPLVLSRGCVRWRLDDVRRWLDAGAPNAAEWKARKVAANSSGRR